VPKEIVFDRDPKFTSNFGRGYSRIQNKYELQYNISPRDRWADIKNQSSD
jgi:hypothetical protein